MAVKKIVKIWENEKILIDNIKFLETPTKKVILPASNATKQIIQDLIDTYQEISCAGIAANQIGYDKQIFIGMKNIDENVDVNSIEEAEIKLPNGKEEKNEQKDNYEIYINPQIDYTDKKSTQHESEGCLSIPFLLMQILRYNKIKIRYYNQGGRVIKKSLDGFLSKLFQHELDHLNGKLMINSKKIVNYALPNLSKKETDNYIELISQYVEYKTNSKK